MTQRGQQNDLQLEPVRTVLPTDLELISHCCSWERMATLPLGQEFHLSEVVPVLNVHYGLPVTWDDVEIKELDSFEDRNFLVKVSPGNTLQDAVSANFSQKLLLKVFSSYANRKRLQAITDILAHVRRCGVNCSRLIVNSAGHTLTTIARPPPSDSRDASSLGSVAGNDSELSKSSGAASCRHLILMEFIDGITVEDCAEPCALPLVRDIGRCCGQLQKALQVHVGPLTHQL